MTEIQMLLIVVASTLYTVLISWKPILEMDDDRTTRWLVTAGGVAIVVVIAAWDGPVGMLDLFVGFGLAVVPVILRAALFQRIQERNRSIESAYVQGQTE